MPSSASAWKWKSLHCRARLVDVVNKFPDDHVIAGINFIILLKTTIEKYLYTVYKSIVSGEAALLTASSLRAKWHGTGVGGME